MSPRSSSKSKSFKKVRSSQFGAVSVSDRLLKLVDLLLMMIIFAAPLFMAGRHPVGALIYVGLIFLMSIAYLAYHFVANEGSWRLTGLEWLLVAATALLFLQSIPLPASVLNSISPAIENWLPIWSEEGAVEGFGSWSYLSLSPDVTRQNLSMFIAHALLLMVTIQRLNTVEDVERILSWIGIAVIAYALLGMAQLLLGNGKFFWIYEHPYRTTNGVTKATFSNENHLAHFLALGIGPLICWILRFDLEEKTSKRKSRKRHSSRRKQAPLRLALMIGLALVGFTGLLTFSRAGLLVIILAFVITTVLCFSKGLLKAKSFALIALSVGAIGVTMTLFGDVDRWTGNVETLYVDSLDEAKETLGRWELWVANYEVFKEFSAVGTGAGSHRWVYPLFYAEDKKIEYTHAESGFVQIMVETGMVGMTILFVAFLILGFKAFRSYWLTIDQRQAACCCAVLCGLIISAVHSISDFVWYIPACLTITILLIACCCRLFQLRPMASPDQTQAKRRRSGIRFPRLASVGSLCIVLISTYWGVKAMVPTAMARPQWEHYLAEERAIKQDGRGKTPQDVVSQRKVVYQSLLAHPESPRMNLTLAKLLIVEAEIIQQSSEVPMSLEEIREAALNAGFEDEASLQEWLKTVLGKNIERLKLAKRFAKRAVVNAPTFGDAYVTLSQLSYLEGQEYKPFIQQALKVRPNNGIVLLASGARSIQQGEEEKAFDFWEKAFDCSVKTRTNLVKSLAKFVPAQELLDRLKPDIRGTRIIYLHYRDNEPKESGAVVASIYRDLLSQAAANESPERAARLWWTASGVNRYLEDGDGVVEALKNAVKLQPTDYKSHLSLARALQRNEQYEEAKAELEWCKRRDPNDPSLINLYRAIVVNPEKLRGRVDTMLK